MKLLLTPPPAPKIILPNQKFGTPLRIKVFPERGKAIAQSHSPAAPKQLRLATFSPTFRLPARRLGSNLLLVLLLSVVSAGALQAQDKTVNEGPDRINVKIPPNESASTNSKSSSSLNKIKGVLWSPVRKIGGVFNDEDSKDRKEAEANEDTAALITNLQNGTHEEVSKAIHALHALGAKAIPDLIESISSDRFVANLLRDPTSAYIQDASLSQYAGVRSAYVIDLILASDKLPNIKKKSDFVLGINPQNYLYSQAVIVKEEKQPISSQDLLIVRGIYQQWWERNKVKLIDDLRKGWLEGERPLKGKQYSWN
jgi:hypothetical protein